MMAEICGIPRKAAKIIFLGICYGMGGAKLARDLGLPTKWIYDEKRGVDRLVAGDEAQALLDQFNERAPYVRRLSYLASDKAKQRGYIVTAGGRKCRFPEKTSGGYDWTHKALNRLIQGSSADQTKRAMVALWEAGFRLQLQVHDEVDLSVNTKEEAVEVGRIMEGCMPCNVPAKVDLEWGPSWGEIQEVA
jgi:DNA polymerase I-like protein with 3'-5' exonuclease and polymerase domains